MANTYLLSDEAKRYLCCYYQILDEMVQSISAAKLTQSISQNTVVQLIPHHRAAVRLCRNILERSHVRYRLSSQDLSLYLASIDDGLMDLQDYFASQYLIKAGHLLTDAPLTKNPTPIE